MGQQLAGIQNLSAPGCQNGVTAVGFRRHSLEVLLAAVELKLSLKRLESLGLQIGDEALTLPRG